MVPAEANGLSTFMTEGESVASSVFVDEQEARATAATRTRFALDVLTNEICIRASVYLAPPGRWPPGPPSGPLAPGPRPLAPGPWPLLPAPASAASTFPLTPIAI